MKNMIVERKYLPALSKLFSAIVMNSIEQKGTSKYMIEVCKNSGMDKYLDPSIKISQVFDLVYNLIIKDYRNEYIYKNIIVQKLLLGKHSLNTTQLLTEFRIGKNKADVILLNGTSYVYEIKSEYDSLKRLEIQLRSYLDAFDFINVITYPSLVNKILPVISDKIGVLVLTNKNTISTIRRPKSNRKNINPLVLFDSLRKDEYLNIINKYYRYIPDVPNTKINKYCKELFSKIPPNEAHDLVINVLKERNHSNILKEFINKAPKSTFAYALSIGDKKKKLERLIEIFDSKIEYKSFSKVN
ncbi:MAG: sce7726 family protein [bacterium]